MRPKSKLWLDKDGELIFGSGKSEILKEVARTGSLNAAAKELGMSYRHVWSCVRSAESRLGKVLLIKTKGGAGGGGAELSEYAKKLIKKFDLFDLDVRRYVDRRFKEIFK